MDEMQQLKCLTNLRDVISQLDAYVRPVPRDDHQARNFHAHINRLFRYGWTKNISINHRRIKR